MRTIVINLDRSPERLAAFDAQAERLGLAYERLSAVDGRTVQEKRGPLTPSEIACFESHRLAWKSLVDSGEPWLAIFEDDVILAPPIAAFLAHPERFPLDADVIKLETFYIPSRLAWRRVRFLDCALHRMLSIHWGAAGYVLSRRAAVRLLKQTEDYTKAVDMILFDPAHEALQDLGLHQVVPALCVQEHVLAERSLRPRLYQTLIDHTHGHPDATRIHGWRKLGRELARMGRQSVSFVRSPTKLLVQRRIVNFYKSA